jgi:hypothetical protein
MGLGWLLYGATFFGYADWDIGVSIVMACSTYLTAEWVWKEGYKPRNWVLAVLFTWWCVDGSYWLYWSLVDPSVMLREVQWEMSLCLYLLSGFVWSVAEDLQVCLYTMKSIGQGMQE